MEGSFGNSPHTEATEAISGSKNPEMPLRLPVGFEIREKMNAGLTSARVFHSAEECWATVSGHRMRYLRMGNGPPVLLIHGLLAYAFSWRFLFPVLAPVRTVIAPDLLGTGHSDRPADLNYGMTAAAERIFEFLDSIGADGIDVVGSSLGGAIATRMAALRPERVNKLVLVSPANPWSRHGRLISRFLATPPGGATFMGMLPAIDYTQNFWLRRLFGDPKRIAPGTLEGYAEPLHTPEAWRYGILVMQHWREDMAQLKHDFASLADKPALLIWGTRDRAVTFSSSKQILERMRKARLEVLPGVGHLPYEEVPEKFNQVVLQYLSG